MTEQTIQFRRCPYHQPTHVESERPMVVDNFLRQFKCAVCDASGTLGPDDRFPEIPVYPSDSRRHSGVDDEQAAKQAFWRAHDRLDTAPRGIKEGLEDDRPLTERIFGKNGGCNDASPKEPR